MFGEELREAVVFGGIEEEFGQALTERGCDHEFGGRDTGSDGAQPGSEGGPNEPRIGTERYCSNPWQMRPVWMKT